MADLTYLFYFDQVVAAVLASLRGDTSPVGEPLGPPKYDVKEMEYELVTREGVEALSLRVRAKPIALVSLGDPEVEESDTSGRTTSERTPLEVVIAYTDERSPLIQKRGARALCMDVRRRIQGANYDYIDDSTTNAIVTFEGLDHIATDDGLTLYSALFSVRYKTTI